MTRDDWNIFHRLEIDCSTIGLEWDGAPPAYFCTPVGAEAVGWIGSDGVHFALLPGDERVFCVEPSMGEPGTYVLPVGRNFREFLSFVLFCRDANPLSQIFWMDEERFNRLLEEDAQTRWPGCEEFFARKNGALEQIAAAFGLEAAPPFARVKELQAQFDPAVLVFSPEYYDVLGLDGPGDGKS